MRALPVGVSSCRPHDPTRIVRRYPPAGIGLLRAHEVFLPDREYIVMEYGERLAIRSVDGATITSWWDMQLVKQAVWGDRFAVEVFLPMVDVIDEAPTRHLWSTPAIEAAAAACSEQLLTESSR